MNIEAMTPLCRMKKYDIQLNPQNMAMHELESMKCHKDDIHKKFLINCLISGLYIYFGILLNIFVLQNAEICEQNVGFLGFRRLERIFSAVRMLISVGGLVKYTIARYLIGYPFLTAGIISAILSAAAFSSMNGKTSKTKAYKITRAFANASYFLPLIFAILFIWVMFIPI